MAPSLHASHSFTQARIALGTRDLPKVRGDLVLHQPFLVCCTFVAAADWLHLVASALIMSLVEISISVGGRYTRKSVGYLHNSLHIHILPYNKYCLFFDCLASYLSIHHG
jgi:hypothetical protein